MVDECRSIAYPADVSYFAQVKTHDVPIELSDVAPPETETERRVGAIWSSVLEGKQIYRTSHFFQLGGESLSAMRMITRVRRDFGMRVPVRAIFDIPTLDRFSAMLDAMQR